jgi:hypothetical protein
MRANLYLVMASVFAVALLAPPAVRAQADPAAPPAAEGLVPAAEAPVPAPVGENPAPASAAEAPAPTPEAETPPIFKAEQLDQLLAPIALYPDALLAQIMMAATYPLEVVKADRWLQDPSHAYLRGDQLAGAIEAEAWDPSVKSLVPFSADLADDGRQARLDRTAGQRRRDTTGRRHGFDPTSSPRSRGGGDALVQR